MNNNIQCSIESSTASINLNSAEDGIYLTPELEGLAGLPEIRTSSGVNAGYDGGWTSAQNYDARLITLRGVSANPDISLVEQKRRQLASIVGQGRKESLTLHFTTEAGRAYTCDVRTISCEMALQRVLTKQDFIIQLRADNPLIYDDSGGSTAGIINVQKELGGFEIDFELPLAIGGGTDISTIVNEGETSNPTIVLNGALHSPTIVNQTTNQQMQILADLEQTPVYSDQISASGNPISFSIDTEYGGKIEELKLNGNATQNGTPTPDYPQDVNVVTGAQNVEVVGKNLFGGLNIASVTYCTASLDGTTLTVTPNDTTHNTAVYLSLGTKILAGTYTFNSSTFISNASQLRNAAGSIVHNFGNGYLNKTFTLTETATAITFNWYSTGSTTPFTVDLSTLQIELGNSASSYESYQGASYEVNLGKNLMTLSGRTLGGSGADVSVQESNSLKLVVGSSPTAYSQRNTVYLLKDLGLSAGDTITISSKISGTYTGVNGASMRIYWDTISQPIPGRLSDTVSSVTLTIPSDATKIQLYFYLAQGTTPSGSDYAQFDELQLEAGSQASSYAPYFTPIELAKIGTYQDYIWNDGGTWKVHKAIGKVVLDGTNATFTSGNNGFVCAYTQANSPFYDKIALGEPSYQSLCDHFIVQPNGTTWTGRGKCGFNSSGAFWLMHTDESITTVVELNTWLSTHPTTVYYALATPTDTAITEQTLIDQLNAVANAQLYSGQNNIMNIAFSPNLAGELEIGYVEMEGCDRDQIIIDSQNQTVTMNGENIYDKIADGSEFITMASGDNKMFLTSEVTSDTGYAEVKFKQGFISI